MKFLERALDGQNEFWKYIIVILFAFFGGQILGSIPLTIVIIIKSMTESGIDMTQLGSLNFEALGIQKNLGLFLMMLAPVGSLVLTVIFIKLLHKRSFSETVNGLKKIRVSRCLQGMIVWGILLAVYTLGDYLIDGKNYVLQFDIWKFIPLFLISVIMIPLQTTSEELLFRGYLAQGIAAWTKNRWLAFLIPGVLFGLLHSANPEVKEFGFWLAMPQYIFFGLLFGFIAVLDDGMELPMGMHAINNVFLSLFVTNKSSALQTDAVLQQINIYPIKETVVLVIAGIISVIYFSRKYKWNFSILNTPVKSKEPDLITEDSSVF